MSLKNLVKHKPKTTDVYVEGIDTTFRMKEPTFVEVRDAYADEDNSVKDMMLTAAMLVSITKGTDVEQGPFEIEDIDYLYKNISMVTYSKLQDAQLRLMGDSPLGKS